MDTRDPSTKLALALLCLMALTLSASAQESSLGDVARASRARQAQSPKPAKVFTNEDGNPQAIKDGDDPLAVYLRARLAFIHDTAHRCQEESSGNSGPGWKTSATYEVAANDRMRLLAQDGSAQMEYLQVGNDYYKKENGASWRKFTDPGEIRLGQITFPGALIPPELQYGFQSGDLKSLGNQTVGATPTVLYRYTTHSSDFNRTINYWFGKQDTLPRRIDMRTESRSWGTAPSIWTESITCTYGIAIKIEPPPL